jgi:hypothetical protein
MDALVMIEDQINWQLTHPEEYWWQRFCNMWWWVGFNMKYPTR